MTTSTREHALGGGRDHRNPRPASIGTGGRLRSVSPGRLRRNTQPGHANTPKSPPTEMLSRPIHAPTDTAFATGPIPVGKTAGHVQQQPAASQGAATGGGAPSEQPSQSRKGISTAAVPATAQNSSAATQTAAPATVRNSTATEPIPTGETAGHVQQEPDHPIHQDQSAATGSSAPPEQPSVSSSARVPTTAQNSYPQNNGATKNPLPHVSSPVVQPPKGALAPNLASQQPPPTAQLLTNPPNSAAATDKRGRAIVKCCTAANRASNHICRQRRKQRLDILYQILRSSLCIWYNCNEF